MLEERDWRMVMAWLISICQWAGKTKTIIFSLLMKKFLPEKIWDCQFLIRTSFSLIEAGMVPPLISTSPSL